MENESEAERAFTTKCRAGDVAACRSLLLLLAKRQDRAREAELTLIKVVAQSADAGDIELLASQLASLANFRLAEQAYRGAIAKGRNDSRFQLALLLLAQPDRRREADPLIAECIASATGDELNNFAGALAKEGGWDQLAELFFRAAIRAGCNYACFNLANLLSRQQRFQEAEQEYMAAIAAGLVTAYNNYGNLLCSQSGREAEAEQAFLKAIAAGENKAFKNLGNLLARRAGRESDAEKAYRSAIQNGNENAQIGLWQLLKRQPGRERESQELFEKVKQFLNVPEELVDFLSSTNGGDVDPR
ncbi:hypothetical protein SAMN05519103_02568 [Rhizobiales bacterium GAS113]|nr:hypothetical protein SAMN05519103_02568 [Rhizobiales bacterium GAS113]